MVRAAIYTRISLDKNGEGLGVERQRKDCRALARAKAWDVTAEYSDNDVSAYNGKARPAYEEMLRAVDAGEFDAVIAYNLDRLTRRPKEFEEFIERCQAGGVTLFSTCSGDTDLGQGDGILVTRILAAAAAHQSDAASRRIRRKNDERAARGLPHSGGRRSFGYTANHLEVIEHEADAYRRAVARYIAGEPVVSIMRMFEQEGIGTTRGGPWRIGTLTRMLANPRYAGLLVRNGEIVGQGVWPPIITRHEYEQITARRARDAVIRPRSPRTHLLTSLLRCGRCGHTLVSQALTANTGVYRCSPAPDTPGCGRMSIRAHQVEDLISRAVLARLDTPRLTDRAPSPDTDQRVTTLTQDIDVLTARLDELTDMWTSGEIDRRAWQRARGSIETQLNAARKELGHLTSSPALDALLEDNESVLDLWNDPDTPIQRKHAIIRALIDRITIQPSTTRGPHFDPSRVEVSWRA